MSNVVYINTEICCRGDRSTGSTTLPKHIVEFATQVLVDNIDKFINNEIEDDVDMWKMFEQYSPLKVYMDENPDEMDTFISATFHIIFDFLNNGVQKGAEDRIRKFQYNIQNEIVTGYEGEEEVYTFTYHQQEIIDWIK